jgi:hypothetical protein
MATATFSRLAVAMVAALALASAATIAACDSAARKAGRLVASFFGEQPILTPSSDGSSIRGAIAELPLGDASDPDTNGAPMQALNATPTDSCSALPASACGVLVLADPPEAGWQMRTRSNVQATVDAELLAAPDYESASE